MWAEHGEQVRDALALEIPRADQRVADLGDGVIDTGPGGEVVERVIIGKGGQGIQRCPHALLVPCECDGAPVNRDAHLVAQHGIVLRIEEFVGQDALR